MAAERELSEAAAMPAGTYNFRDLGGLPAVDGRRTRWKVLYRSDSLDDLDADGVRMLRETLGVAQIIDLRAGIEGAGSGPSWRDEAVAFVNLPLSDDWTDWGPLDDESRRTLLARKYMSYLEAASDNVVAALELIARNGASKPTVVHCAVGKDRTGVVVAVLLALLRVDRRAIVADYVRTAANMQPIMERLRASAIYRPRVETNPVEVYLAEEHTIRGFLDALDEKFGSAEAWALRHGLTEARLQELRRDLLEPTERSDA